jgi:hypothetical protein
VEHVVIEDGLKSDISELPTWVGYEIYAYVPTIVRASLFNYGASYPYGRFSSREGNYGSLSIFAEEIIQA